MQNTTSMTQKGQVTIPQQIRKTLRVGRDSKFIVKLDATRQRVVLEPMKDLLSLANSLKSKMTLTDAQLKKARASFWVSRQK